MKYVSVESSNLEAVAYDEASLTFGVRFKNGSEYEYYGVPKHVFDGILSAPSAGKYFNANVKETGYRYREIR